SGSQADDLVQEVMLSVWRHAAGYRPELSSVSTWIFRIARNRFIDAVRKERFVPFHDDADGKALPLHERSAADAFETQELGAQVEAALEELPREQAEVVRGSYFTHESAAQMAERMRIPI